MHTASRWARRGAQVGLGLFILGQLCFLPAANFLGMLEHARPEVRTWPPVVKAAPHWARGEGPVYHTLKDVSRLTGAWAEFTGQPQNWSLFAPLVGDEAAFVALEFRWDDDPASARALAHVLTPLTPAGPLPGLCLWAAAEQPRPAAAYPSVHLLSENEPEDLHAFFRVGKFRVRRYEGSIDLTLSIPEGETAAAMADRWRERIAHRVHHDGAYLHAYMRWRLRAFLESHPDLPSPRQVILSVRLYRVPPPCTEPWFWQGPEEHPVARWQPDAHWDPGYAPVEMYNPVVPRFESVWKGP